jgi:hypothetical protein
LPILFAATAPTVTRVVESQPQAQALPSLSRIIGVYGKPTSSAEFTTIAKECGLRLYSRTEDVYLTMSSLRDPKSYPVERRERFGGSGLVFTANSRVMTRGDLSTAVYDDPRIVGVRIVVGPCLEQEYFGLWRGEMPAIELCQTPESLVARYPDFDSDVENVEFSGTTTRTRRINYYIQPLENRFPYAFVFNNGKLAYIEIYPRDVSPKVIRPQAPP